MAMLKFPLLQLIILLLSLWACAYGGRIKHGTWKADVNKHVFLNSGLRMPVVGYGTFQGEDQVIEAALEKALKAGARNIDTAAFYRNEHVIGRVLKRWFSSENLTRDYVFVTTKLPQYDCQPELVAKSFEQSLRNLQLDYVDLYLIHMPYYVPQTDAYDKDGRVKIIDNDFVAVYKELEKLVKLGKVRSIGLSNFNQTQIEKILAHATIKPAVLQTELHVYLQEKALVEFCRKNYVSVTSYASLGSRAIYKTVFKHKIPPPNMLEDPVVVGIAKKHGKTAAQLLLRFLTQKHIPVIPYSLNEEHIQENANIVDFLLDEADMEALHKLDQGEKARILRTSEIVKGIEKHPNYPFPY